MSDAEGHWEPIPDALYATTTARCDLCGKMIVGRLWRASHAGRSLRFCDQRCERTWLEYWLPRYGGAEPGSAEPGSAEPRPGTTGATPPTPPA